jgi:hypothetical protein
LGQLERFDEVWRKFLGFFKSVCIDTSAEVCINSLKCINKLVEQEYSSLNMDISGKIFWEIWVTYALLGDLITKPADIYSEESESSNCTIIWSDESKPTIISGHFTQEGLALYVQIFRHLYPKLGRQFDSDELKKILRTIKNILLYHSLPPVDSTSRLWDVINDKESLSGVQKAIFDLVTNTNFGQIEGWESIMLLFFSDASLLPFVTWRPAPRDDRCMSYIAFSKKFLFRLIEEFEGHKECRLIYENGSFVHIINSLNFLMRERYDGPFSGGSNELLLWKIASDAAMKICNAGLSFISLECRNS